VIAPADEDVAEIDGTRGVPHADLAGARLPDIDIFPFEDVWSAGSMDAKCFAHADALTNIGD
jgi:hypothetical protein